MKLLPILGKVRSIVGFVGLVSLGAVAIFTGMLFPRGQFGSQSGASSLEGSGIAHADAPSCATCGASCESCGGDGWGDGCGGCGDGSGDCSG